MGITDWPLEERPREKLLIRGASALSDAELLAIFLRTGIQGKTAVDLARDLLVQFGSLSRLLQANQADFCQCKGLGVAKYAQLQATIEMGRRYAEDDLVREGLVDNSLNIKLYLIKKLRHHKREVFACIFLDAHHRIISFDEVFMGTVHRAHVYPREVVRMAMEKNAVAVIFAHNHPSGIAQESEADIAMTIRLKDALQLMDVKVLDHIIVGGCETVSLAEKALI